ncbi:MAG: acetylserotonin O-methyltransferase [Thermodesulfovibrionales bacterium]|nr:acetylserotonin O-methyltransferase [Thermodesulfovibrionales bacterium]
MKLKDELNSLRMLWGGYWSSKILLTANSLEIFEHLKSPKSAQEISSSLQTDLRATKILLDALTGLRLLKKTSKGYHNTSLTNRFLVSDSPYYHGNIVKHMDTIWRNWSELENIVKTGKPARIAMDNASFIRGMHDISKLKAKTVLNKINLSGVRKALDLGGGPGTYSIEMAKKGISVTLFDLPETIEVAKEIINDSGIISIDLLAGDFLVDDIGSGYDLIFISQILHAFSEDENIKIIDKSVKALNQKGRVVIQEFYIDNSLSNPAKSAIFAVNMLVNTARGRCYSPDEIKKWCKKAGLKRFEKVMFEDCIIISATK